VKSAASSRFGGWLGVKPVKAFGNVECGSRGRGTAGAMRARKGGRVIRARTRRRSACMQPAGRHPRNLP
jgi:hypothetical protein